MIELFPHLMAQGIVIAQGGQVLSQGLPVSGGDQEAVDAGVDEVGDAAHGGSHSGQVEPGALRQSVGEGLGQGGEGVDVQGGVEAVHTAADPAGKGHLLFHAQLPGQVLQLFPLLAVAGDDQTQPGTFAVSGGKAPDEGGHVLDGIEAGGDAHHHGIIVHVGPQAH